MYLREEVHVTKLAWIMVLDVRVLYHNSEHVISNEQSFLAIFTTDTQLAIWLNTQRHYLFPLNATFSS